jgi:hypothetical protein
MTEWIVQESKPGYVQKVGFYLAAFIGVEAVTITVAGKQEAKWRFKWKVEAGEEADKIASALTDCSIDPAKLAGVLIAGLLVLSLTIPAMNS